MTIERRLQLTTGALILFVAMTAAILYWSSQQVERGIKTIESTSEVVQSAFMLKLLMDDYLDHGGKRSLRQWHRRHESLGRMVNDTTFIESVDPSLLEDLKQSFDALTSISPRIIALGQANASEESPVVKDLLHGLISLRSEQLVNTAIELNAATQTLTLKKRKFVQWLIMATSVIMVVIIVINLYLIRKSLIAPLRVLSDGAESVGEGQFDSITEIPRDDEVGRLTRAFNAMIEGLKRRTTALKQARDELERTVEERTAALTTIHAQNELLQAVQRSQAQFISHGNPDELFENLLRDLLVLTRSEFGFIGEMLHSEDGEMYLRDRAITDISWDDESRKIYQQFANDHGLDFFNIRGLGGSAILTGEPVISNDPANDPRRSGLPDGHPKLSSFMGIPLHSGGEVIGLAGIANRSGGYDSELLDFLQPYISTCAQILEGDRNKSRREEAERQLIQAHEELERKVLERTADLLTTNELLEIEIARRERVEEAVRAERQQLYDLLEALPVYVMLTARDYRVQFANRLFRERFGESPGKRCFEYLHGRSEPCDVCATFSVLETMALHHWEWQGLDGRHYEVQASPFIDTDGSTLVMEVGIDITERKRAEEARKQILDELIRSNADLEQFAYVASHDLQEPLRNVAGSMQLLEKRYKGKLDAEADKLIWYAVDSVARMKALIIDLLAYSRVSTRGKALKPVNCEEVLEQTLRSLRPSIAESGSVITHDPLPTVIADFTQLMQVVQNLLANAIKFRGTETPHIHVSASRDGDNWVFCVKDNGIGIESRYLDRIFLIFQRLHKKSEYEGTGMGLAIVKKILERHHGRIWVESEPGKGTTFYFTIPASATTRSEVGKS